MRHFFSRLDLCRKQYAKAARAARRRLWTLDGAGTGRRFESRPTIRPLERRRVFNADFAFDPLTDNGVELLNFTDPDPGTPGVELTISNDGNDNYLFTLNEGVWSGTDFAGVIEGDNSATLTIFGDGLLPAGNPFGAAIDDLPGGINLDGPAGFPLDVSLENPDLGDLTGPLTLQAIGGLSQQSGSTVVDELVVTASDDLTLETLNLVGSLDATAGGDVTDVDGPIVVTGDANFTSTAPDGDITLDNAANDFGGAVDADGVNVTLNDADGIVLGAIDATTLNVTAGDEITQNDAGVSVTGDTDLNATGFDITLDDADNDFGSAVAANGANVSLTDANSIELGDITTTGGLTVAALSGDITQAAGTTVSVANGQLASFTATGEVGVSADPLNVTATRLLIDVGESFNVVNTPDAADPQDLTDLTVVVTPAGGDFDYSLISPGVTEFTLADAGADLAVGPITTAANLSITTRTGNLNVVGPINADAADVKLAAAATDGDLVVTNAITTAADVGLVGRNVTQAAPIAAAGLLVMASGNVTLDRADNDFRTVAVSERTVPDPAGAVSLVTRGPLTVGDVSVTVNAVAMDGSGVRGADVVKIDVRDENATTPGTLTIDTAIFVADSDATDANPTQLALVATGDITQPGGGAATEVITAEEVLIMTDGNVGLDRDNAVDVVAADLAATSTMTFRATGNLAVGQVDVLGMTATGISADGDADGTDAAPDTTYASVVKVTAEDDLNLEHGIDAATVGLVAGGDITQDPAALIRGPVVVAPLADVDNGADLFVMAEGNVTLDQNNLVDVVAADLDTDTVFLLRTVTDLSVGSVTVAGMSATGVSADDDASDTRPPAAPVTDFSLVSGATEVVLDADGDITLDAGINAQRVGLIADGDITQGADGLVRGDGADGAELLALAQGASHKVLLNQTANRVDAVAGRAADDFYLNTALDLSVATVLQTAPADPLRVGVVAGGPTGDVKLESAGSIAVDQQVNGRNVALVAGTGITQTAGAAAPIAVGDGLFVMATNDAVLNGDANAVSTVAADVNGFFWLRTTESLTVGDVTVQINETDPVAGVLVADMGAVGISSDGDTSTNPIAYSAAVRLEAGDGAAGNGLEDVQLAHGIDAERIGLVADGDVTQQPTGLLRGPAPAAGVVSRVVVDAGGTVLLEEANLISELAGRAGDLANAPVAGSFRFVNVRDLYVTEVGLPTGNAAAPETAPIDGVSGDADVRLVAADEPSGADPDTTPGEGSIYLDRQVVSSATVVLVADDNIAQVTPAAEAAGYGVRTSELLVLAGGDVLLEAATSAADPAAVNDVDEIVAEVGGYFRLLSRGSLETGSASLAGIVNVDGVASDGTSDSDSMGMPTEYVGVTSQVEVKLAAETIGTVPIERADITVVTPIMAPRIGLAAGRNITQEADGVISGLPGGMPSALQKTELLAMASMDGLGDTSTPATLGSVLLNEAGNLLSKSDAQARDTVHITTVGGTSVDDVILPAITETSDPAWIVVPDLQRIYTDVGSAEMRLQTAGGGGGGNAPDPTPRRDKREDSGVASGLIINKRIEATEVVALVTDGAVSQGENGAIVVTGSAPGNGLLVMADGDVTLNVKDPAVTGTSINNFRRVAVSSSDNATAPARQVLLATQGDLEVGEVVYDTTMQADGVYGTGTVKIEVQDKPAAAGGGPGNLTIEGPIRVVASNPAGMPPIASVGLVATGDITQTYESAGGPAHTIAPIDDAGTIDANTQLQLLVMAEGDVRLFDNNEIDVVAADLSTTTSMALRSVRSLTVGEVVLLAGSADEMAAWGVSADGDTRSGLNAGSYAQDVKLQAATNDRDIFLQHGVDAGIVGLFATRDLYQNAAGDGLIRGPGAGARLLADAGRDVLLQRVDNRVAVVAGQAGDDFLLQTEVDLTVGEVTVAATFDTIAEGDVLPGTVPPVVIRMTDDGVEAAQDIKLTTEDPDASATNDLTLERDVIAPRIGLVADGSITQADTSTIGAPAAGGAELLVMAGGDAVLNSATPADVPNNRVLRVAADVDGLFWLSTDVSLEVSTVRVRVEDRGVATDNAAGDGDATVIIPDMRLWGVSADGDTRDAPTETPPVSPGDPEYSFSHSVRLESDGDILFTRGVDAEWIALRADGDILQDTTDTTAGLLRGPGQGARVVVDAGGSVLLEEAIDIDTPADGVLEENRIGKIAGVAGASFRVRSERDLYVTAVGFPDAVGGEASPLTPGVTATNDIRLETTGSLYLSHQLTTTAAAGVVVLDADGDIVQQNTGIASANRLNHGVRSSQLLVSSGGNVLLEGVSDAGDRLNDVRTLAAEAVGYFRLSTGGSLTVGAVMLGSVNGTFTPGTGAATTVTSGGTAMQSGVTAPADVRLDAADSLTLDAHVTSAKAGLLAGTFVTQTGNDAVVRRSAAPDAVGAELLVQADTVLLDFENSVNTVAMRADSAGYVRSVLDLTVGEVVLDARGPLTIPEYPGDTLPGSPTVEAYPTMAEVDVSSDRDELAGGLTGDEGELKFHSDGTLRVSEAIEGIDANDRVKVVALVAGEFARTNDPTPSDDSVRDHVFQDADGTITAAQLLIMADGDVVLEADNAIDCVAAHVEGRFRLNDAGNPPGTTADVLDVTTVEFTPVAAGGRSAGQMSAWGISADGDTRTTAAPATDLKLTTAGDLWLLQGVEAQTVVLLADGSIAQTTQSTTDNPSLTEDANGVIRASTGLLAQAGLGAGTTDGIVLLDRADNEVASVAGSADLSFRLKTTTALTVDEVILPEVTVTFTPANTADPSTPLPAVSETAAGAMASGIAVAVSPAPSQGVVPITDVVLGAQKIDVEESVSADQVWLNSETTIDQTRTGSVLTTDRAASGLVVEARGDVTLNATVGSDGSASSDKTDDPVNEVYRFAAAVTNGSMYLSTKTGLRAAAIEQESRSLSKTVGSITEVSTRDPADPTVNGITIVNTPATPSSAPSPSSKSLDLRAVSPGAMDSNRGNIEQEFTDSATLVTPIASIDVDVATARFTVSDGRSVLLNDFDAQKYGLYENPTPGGEPVKAEALTGNRFYNESVELDGDGMVISTTPFGETAIELAVERGSAGAGSLANLAISDQTGVELPGLQTIDTSAATPTAIGDLSINDQLAIVAGQSGVTAAGVAISQSAAVTVGGQAQLHATGGSIDLGTAATLDIAAPPEADGAVDSNMMPTDLRGNLAVTTDGGSVTITNQQTVDFLKTFDISAFRGYPRPASNLGDPDIRTAEVDTQIRGDLTLESVTGDITDQADATVWVNTSADNQFDASAAAFRDLLYAKLTVGDTKSILLGNDGAELDLERTMIVRAMDVSLADGNDLSFTSVEDNGDFNAAGVFANVAQTLYATSGSGSIYQHYEGTGNVTGQIAAPNAAFQAPSGGVILLKTAIDTLAVEAATDSVAQARSVSLTAATEQDELQTVASDLSTSSLSATSGPDALQPVETAGGQLVDASVGSAGGVEFSFVIVANDGGVVVGDSVADPGSSATLSGATFGALANGHSADNAFLETTGPTSNITFQSPDAVRFEFDDAAGQRAFTAVAGGLVEIENGASLTSSTGVVNNLGDFTNFDDRLGGTAPQEPKRGPTLEFIGESANADPFSNGSDQVAFTGRTPVDTGVGPEPIVQQLVLTIGSAGESGFHLDIVWADQVGKLPALPPGNTIDEGLIIAREVPTVDFTNVALDWAAPDSAGQPLDTGDGESAIARATIRNGFTRAFADGGNPNGLTLPTEVRLFNDTAINLFEQGGQTNLNRVSSSPAEAAGPARDDSYFQATLGLVPPPVPMDVANDPPTIFVAPPPLIREPLPPAPPVADSGDAVFKTPERVESRIIWGIYNGREHTIDIDKRIEFTDDTELFVDEIIALLEDDIYPPDVYAIVVSEEGGEEKVVAILRKVIRRGSEVDVIVLEYDPDGLPRQERFNLGGEGTDQEPTDPDPTGEDPISWFFQEDATPAPVEGGLLGRATADEPLLGADDAEAWRAWGERAGTTRQGGSASIGVAVAGAVLAARRGAQPEPGRLDRQRRPGKRGHLGRWLGRVLG